MNETNPNKHLCIWQQNVAKSGTVQHDVLAGANPQRWDIIALQEPYLDFLRLTHTNAHWNVIYLSNKNLENQNCIQSIILVNTNIQSSQVQQIKIQSSNITAVKITTNTCTLILFNIYNDNNHNHSINMLVDEWDVNEELWTRSPTTEIIILGDFNRHHSTWEAMHNNHLTSPDRLLNLLLDLVVNMRLEMALL